MVGWISGDVCVKLTVWLNSVLPNALQHYDTTLLLLGLAWRLVSVRKLHKCKFYLLVLCFRLMENACPLPCGVIGGFLLVQSDCQWAVSCQCWAVLLPRGKKKVTQRLYLRSLLVGKRALIPSPIILWKGDAYSCYHSVCYEKRKAKRLSWLPAWWLSSESMTNCHGGKTDKTGGH